MRHFLFVLAIVSVGYLHSVAAEKFEIHGPPGSGSFGEAVKVLPNGNFIVVDTSADLPVTDVGAVYLYNGVTRELISRLHGQSYFDRIGSSGITILPSGDFLVRSPQWATNSGAITWCSQSTGCDGPVSAANSMIGSTTNSYLGGADPVILPNGSYVVRAGGMWVRGFVRLCTGGPPCVGPMTAANSLTGDDPNSPVGAAYVNPLSNGGYVVGSPDWNFNRGAVTFCDGATGCSGFVSAENSLIGSSEGDRVGDGGVVEVGDGNYVVTTLRWKNGDVERAGAVTWLSGASPRGVVSPANSLVGADRFNTFFVTVLKNKNYVVISAINNSTNNTRGGATFGDGNTGVFGLVTAQNSLVGTGTNADFYTSSVTPLENGNYVVNTPSWSQFPISGAVTFCNGTTGCTGQISESRSLVGVGNYGYTDGVTPLVNGNYVVKTSNSTTFGSGTTGISGRITAENSLISPNHAGLGLRVVPLPNGNYYVLNSSWDPPAAPGGGSRGAATLCNGETGTSGITSEANSIVNDHSSAVTEFYHKVLPTGDILLQNSRWRDYRGAVTRLSGTTPPTGVISAQNSLVGTSQYDYIGGTVNVLENGSYVVAAHNWGGTRGLVRVCRAGQPCVGEVSESTSIVGTNTNDRVGGGNNLTGVIAVGRDHFVISSPNWNGDRGAAVLVDSRTGITGHVGLANSLIGNFAGDGVSSGHWGATPPLYGTRFLGDGLFALYSPGVDSLQRVNAGAITIASIYRPLAGSLSHENSFVGGPLDEGSTLRFEYDKVNRQVIIGRWLSKAVTVIRPDVPVSSARISGTVRTPGGAPLRNTVIKLNTQDGSVFDQTTTSSFGLFAFENIPMLRDYTITVGSRRYRFASRTVLQVMGDVNVGDLIGLE